MRQLFLSIPIELEEAAALDGCTRRQTFVRVVLPLAKPGLATLAIFMLLGAWNDPVWSLIAISSEGDPRSRLGIANLNGPRRAQWSLRRAEQVFRQPRSPNPFRSSRKGGLH